VLIYLTGFMGAGKSTTARALAQRLGLRFLDLDRRIERSSGRRVPEILRTEGEAAFRSLESRELRRTTEADGAVVATGGGVVCDASNVQLMRAHGAVVWLNVPFDRILDRLGPASRARRPLFGTPEAARRLWEARRPLYADCDLEVEPAADETAKDLAERIARRLEVLTCDT